MSVYNGLEARGYKIQIWPALIPSREQIEKYGKRLARYVLKLAGVKEAGTAADPQRFSEQDLAERRLSKGQSGFTLQYMLDTSLSDAERYPLKLRDLIVTDLDPDNGPDTIRWSGSPEQTLKDLPAVGFQGDLYQEGIVPPSVQFTPYTGAILAVDPSGKGADETATGSSRNSTAVST